ncbi:right-handed parallel beta-helix repeat-containing protein [Flavobacterium aquicola]|uniref:Parallel beta helix pectate lyase-like protein n=1 Tax=Flavobacterium aquicola TaxID=1682742 RepID=A0A3E0EJA6_9FLAO|nr:right-handed parallel beta-helix repeat-containing protein [Flavobacterium aquicola]REG98245.1 parallel beta helix pectate lyase-like protein [Flavobacterium aquicola]
MKKYIKYLAVIFVSFIFQMGCGQNNSKMEYKNIPGKIQARVFFYNALGNKSSENKFLLEDNLPAGYVKDGSVDYTKYLQKGINDNKIVIFPNFPIMVNDTGLVLENNSEIYFQENSEIILQKSNKDTYNILEIHNKHNIKIFNPKITGDRKEHFGNSGEHGMGIGIRSSKQIEIYNSEISNCWGDGIYIGSLKTYDDSGNFIPSEDIIIKNSKLDYNRRNGISITCGRNINVSDVLISNTIGTAPMAAVDIEPNNNKDYMEKIVLENIITFNNRFGIQLVLKKMVGIRKKNVDVVINKHYDFGSKIGFRVAAFKNTYENNFPKLDGNVLVNDCIWENNTEKPIVIQKNQKYSCLVNFEKGKVVDKNNNLTKVNKSSIEIHDNFNIKFTE